VQDGRINAIGPFPYFNAVSLQKGVGFAFGYDSTWDHGYIDGGDVADFVIEGSGNWFDYYVGRNSRRNPTTRGAKYSAPQSGDWFNIGGNGDLRTSFNEKFRVMGKSLYDDSAKFSKPVLLFDVPSGLSTDSLLTWNGSTVRKRPQTSGMVYPGAGIAVSTGSAWGSSIVDNSINWNTVLNRVLYTDTAAMLSNYKHWAQGYIKASDTSSMLSPYYKTSFATASLALKVNISDTSSMLSNYRHWLAGYTKNSDTASMLTPYARKNIASTLFSDTTNYKVSVWDGSGNLRKMYWPTSLTTNYYTTNGSFSSNRTVQGSGFSLSYLNLASLGIDAVDGGIGIDNSSSTTGQQYGMLLSNTSATLQGYYVNRGSEIKVALDSIILKPGFKNLFVDSLNHSLSATDKMMVWDSANGKVATRLLSAGGSGVTSVATNTGTGITGGTITSTGTIAADTAAVLLTKAENRRIYDSGAVTFRNVNVGYKAFKYSSGVFSFKSDVPGYGILIDSTSNDSTRTIKADTAVLFPAIRATITGGGGSGGGNVYQDGNKNVGINNFDSAYATTVTAAGTTTLTNSSDYYQNFTGSTTQTVVLPKATTFSIVGHGYYIVNSSSGALTVNKNGGTLLQTVAAGQTLAVTCTDISSAAGSWNIEYSSDLNIGTATATSINGFATAQAATVSTIAVRDANGNLFNNNTIENYATTATAAGTTTLTVSSSYQQFFTGATTQTVTLPVTSTLVLGQSYLIVNNSTGLVTVNSSGANNVIILAAGTSATVTCILTSGTTAASWNVSYVAANAATGKKLTVNNTLTLAGTDGTTMTFPTTSATIARTDAANTFTGVQTMTSPATTTSITTGSTSFTAWAGATTLLTLGGTGASASTNLPSTLDATSSVTGALRTAGGISCAKALNVGTNITGAGSILTTGTAGLGYGSGGGAGGTVTQLTNRTTGVTLSKITGTITTNTTSLATSAAATFTVTNTLVGINDVIILNVRSGATNVKTTVAVTTVAAGSFNITVFNQDATTAEVGAIIINFAVIKGSVN